MIVDAKILHPRTGKLAVLEAVQNNWYEASRWSPNRSWVWYPLQDARKDLDRFTRYELSKHARYLWKNSPFIRGIIERLVTVTIGSGLVPVFKSKKDPTFAVDANQWWKERSRNIHLGPKCSFSQYQRCLGRARFNDGECYTVKTYSESLMEDRIQGIEADYVTGGTSNSVEEKQGPRSVDGILLNNQNEPVAYKMRSVEQPYPASDVIHHFTPNRLMQFRGETILAAAINTARDVDDILALEKQAVKDASSKQDIIQTSSGELTVDQFRSLRYQQNFPTVFNLPADDRTKDDYYRIKFGGQPVVLKKGDVFTPYKPDRPGNAWQGFIDFLSNTIGLSTGFPPSVFLPIDIGGTDIRRDLDIAQRVVGPIQVDIALELDEIVHYFADGAALDGGDLSGAPDDWYLAWHFPSKINVDRQQAQQDRLDVQAGLMSTEEYHARYGDDGDAYEATVIAEAKRRKERIKEAGFKTVQEFVQVLSLDPKMFQQKPGSPDGAPPKGQSNAVED